MSNPNVRVGDGTIVVFNGSENARPNTDDAVIKIARPPE